VPPHPRGRRDHPPAINLPRAPRPSARLPAPLVPRLPRGRRPPARAPSDSRAFTGPWPTREGFLVAFPGRHREETNWKTNGPASSTSSRRQRHRGPTSTTLAFVHRAGRRDRPRATPVEPPAGVRDRHLQTAGSISHYTWPRTCRRRLAAIGPGRRRDRRPRPRRGSDRRQAGPPVLMLQGHARPAGALSRAGAVAFRGRGKIIDTEEAARRWARAETAGARPVREPPARPTAKDRCGGPPDDSTPGRGATAAR